MYDYRNPLINGYPGYNNGQNAQLYGNDQTYGMYGNMNNNSNNNSYTPPPMPGNTTENILYPYEASSASPFLNTPPTANSFAKGGKVKKGSKKGKNPKSYSLLAEKIRQQGEGEDMILAHINPSEAQLLESISGGNINPKTGLPQFGFFDNPFKWLKSVAGGTGGAILGNMLLPGIGGIIGGALGGAGGSALRGRKDYAQAALRGAGTGAMLPSLASFAGAGANALGMTGAGNYLTNYGNQNSILTALGMGASASGAGASAGGGSLGKLGAALSLSRPSGNLNPNNDTYLSSGVPAGAAQQAEDQGFLGMLGDKSKSFFSDPKNLLAAAVAGSSFFGRPKEETPEQRAGKEKRYQNALLPTPEELKNREAIALAEEQGRRRVNRNKYLPEERLGSYQPLYARTNTPEEYRRSGKWIDYYANPNFAGQPMFYKEGGKVDHSGFFVQEDVEPSGLSHFISGEFGGQDDNIMKNLADGSFILPADVVADVGDGNSLAGAGKLQALVSSGEVEIKPKGVMKIGKGSHKKGVSKLDALIKNVRKHKNVKTGLPPKAKSLASYMRKK